MIADVTVQQTPLPDQNIYGLTALTPGMTGSAVTAGDNYTNEYAININAAGLRQEQNGYIFASSDERQIFQARLDGFSFSRLAPYDRWETFRDEARRLVFAVRRMMKGVPAGQR